ncbi:MAG: hypothetical protein ACMXYC_02690, partial [Candidatus Woesearchaeota archaeon]
MIQHTPKKGQIISIDVIIGFSLFLIVVLSLFWMWHQMRLEDATQDVVTRRAGLSLFYTQGEPVYWHTQETFNRVGVLSGVYVDMDKIEALNTSNRVPYVLGIRGYDWGFWYALYDDSWQDEVVVRALDSMVIQQYRHVGVLSNGTLVLMVLQVGDGMLSQNFFPDVIENDEWISISTCGQFYGIRNNMSGKYRLINDIDCS